MEVIDQIEPAEIYFFVFGIVLTIIMVLIFKYFLKKVK